MSEKNPQNPVEYKVAILTPYLTSGIKQLTGELGEGQAFEQMMMFGYDPANLNGVNSLPTTRGNIVRIWSPDYENFDRREKADIESLLSSDLVISGCTESAEDEVIAMKDSGLVVARFSIFYGQPSAYTKRTPEQSGYSLDLPKSNPCAFALITSEKTLEALASREEARIRDAIEELNRGKEQCPILITSYLSEALKIKK